MHAPELYCLTFGAEPASGLGQLSQVTLSRTGFDTNIYRFSKPYENPFETDLANLTKTLANENVGLFALLSSGHGPLLGYSSLLSLINHGWRTVAFSHELQNVLSHELQNGPCRKTFELVYPPKYGIIAL